VIPLCILLFIIKRIFFSVKIKMSTYKCISNFGQGAARAPSNNPLTYCLSQTLDTEFTHGAISETVSSVNGRNCTIQP